MADGSGSGRRSLMEGMPEASHAPLSRKSNRRHNLMVAGSGILIVIAVGFALYSLFSRHADPGDASRRRAAIDSVTGEVFPDLKIRDGDSQPWKNPRSGSRTVFPAEMCFWTADGGAKLEPTYVLLNQFSGKDGPTLCPDCGREVVSHNPMPPLDLIEAASRTQVPSRR